MDAANCRRTSLLAFCALCLVFYVYGVISSSFMPSHIEGIILPLYFMVGIPLGFFFLVVKKPCMRL